MVATTFSDEASGEHGLKQHNSKSRKLGHEPESYSCKELEDSHHDFVAGFDTGRDLEEPPVEKIAPQKSKDPNLVTWESDDDPENPRNWSPKRKRVVLFLVSAFTFISPVSSSMVAPSLGAMKTDLGISGEFEAAMILSIFVLAYAIGPLMFGPLSEMYGRVRVLQYDNLIYLIFNFVCGFAKTGPQMLVFRFFAGFGESLSL